MDKWKTLAEKIDCGIFGNATVLADGYKVTFVKRIDKNKLVIETFVNDEISGKWMSAENEKPVYPESRFFNPKKSSVWKRKEYKGLKRVYGKKKADEMIKPKVIMFSPVWGSTRTLIAHLKRNFPDLELVDENEAKQSA